MPNLFDLLSSWMSTRPEQREIVRPDDEPLNLDEALRLLRARRNYERGLAFSFIPMPTLPTEGLERKRAYDALQYFMHPDVLTNTPRFRPRMKRQLPEIDL